MKYRYWIFCLLCLTPAISTAQLEQRLDDVMNEAGPALNGASLVVLQDGVELYNASVGNQSSDQPRPVGSGSKWFSSTVIMTLVDEGLLNFNDSVGEHLPQFTGDAADIELWMLMSNTSGFSEDPDYVYSDEMTLAEVVDSISVSMQPEYEPGTSFCYVDAPFSIAGRIAEVVTGQSWATICQERLAGPLDMEIYWIHEFNPAPAGTLIVSAEDYITFLEMIRNHGMHNDTQILSPETVDLIQAGYLDGVNLVEYPDLLIYDEIDYGIGHWNFTDQVNDQTINESASPGLWGFMPWIQDDINLSVSFMAVDAMETAITYIDEIRIILNEELNETSVSESSSETLPITMELNTYPNPFNSMLRISLVGMNSNEVEVNIYDLLGRQVASFIKGSISADANIVSWDPQNLASGLYFVTATGPDYTFRKKVAYLR